MTICGLWHGAAWTYIVFGFLHGVRYSRSSTR
jgi:D-alanyl-lipoteichoic acid acyltransferase DltB (MBOAT superfamily)